ncbi:MAG: ABC transporter ATP-binding protein, partial [Pseudolabrys sp.]
MRFARATKSRGIAGWLIKSFCGRNHNKGNVGKDARDFGPFGRMRHPRGGWLMQLRAENLGCRRGGREAFTGLNVAVGAGEALLVTGRNGSGKSSLLRQIAGLVRLAA